MKKGTHHSAETKEKLRQCNLGKKNPEHSKRMKGRKAWNKGIKRYWDAPGSFKKGERKGVNNVNWKGEFVSYSALHHWIKREKGKPIKCDKCKATDKLQWANVDHKYSRKTEDYISMCAKCHQKYDIENNGYKGGIKRVTI